jgi:hypothetical protein
MRDRITERRIGLLSARLEALLPLAPDAPESPESSR